MKVYYTADDEFGNQIKSDSKFAVRLFALQYSAREWKNYIKYRLKKR